MDTIKSPRLRSSRWRASNHDEVMQVKKALKDKAHPQIVSQFLGTVRSADGKEMEVDKTRHHRIGQYATP